MSFVCQNLVIFFEMFLYVIVQMIFLYTNLFINKLILHMAIYFFFCRLSFTKNRISQSISFQLHLQWVSI